MSTKDTVKTTTPAKKKVAAKSTRTAKTDGKESVAKAAKAPAVPKAAKSAKAKPVEAKAIAVPTHEEIARLAVQYWIERGYEHGKAEQDWFRAEQELRGMAS